MPNCSIVICKPGFSISTPELFRKLDEVSLRRHPDTAGMLAALREEDLRGIGIRMYNVFEDVPDKLRFAHSSICRQEHITLVLKQSNDFVSFLFPVAKVFVGYFPNDNKRIFHSQDVLKFVSQM